MSALVWQFLIALETCCHVLRPSVVAGAVLAGTGGTKLREYRYTFLDHADEERAVRHSSSRESERTPGKLANECWEGRFRYVEVWRAGRWLRLAKCRRRTLDFPPNRRKAKVWFDPSV